MKLLTLLSLIYSSLIFASTDQVEELNEWKNSGFSQVRINFYSNNFKVVQAVITDDIDGKQVLEFRYSTKKGKECSNQELNLLTDVVVRINNVRVRMKSGCKSALFSKYIGYYASTIKGREYITTEFSKGESVRVELQNLKLYFPSQGFNYAWKKHGDNAI